MDDFTHPNGSGRDENAALSQTTSSPSAAVPPAPFAQDSTLRPTISRPPALRQSTIGIRRIAPTPKQSSTSLRSDNDGFTDNAGGIGEVAGRRRSTSAPQPPVGQDMLAGKNASRRPIAPAPMHMSTLDEEGSVPAPTSAKAGNRPTIAGGRLQSMIPGRMKRTTTAPVTADTLGREYNAEIVDLLDVIDPEVSTLSTLTNVQNSLFVPELGRFVNRRPTYNLSRHISDVRDTETPTVKARARALSDQSKRARKPSDTTSYATAKPKPLDETKEEREEREEMDRIERTSTVLSITSVLTDSHYAVLPHGVSISDWSEEEKVLLNDHVRHALHSRRAAFKRGLKGFGQYVRKPLGFLVTLYAFLITAFGLLWVLFLIGWLSVGEKQSYVTNIVDNVLVALFAIVGDGLAPFRAVDTYHMIYIVHYHFLTWRLRRKKALPKLPDKNDLPDAPTDKDVESGPNEPEEASVLSPVQQLKLAHHQGKFSKSHTFYKPHETTTHRAFSVRLLLAIVVLLDLHSCFQIALGACTWGISYHVRPEALTATILSFSITCNVTAGLLISLGDRRTRKKEVIEKMFRQALTEEAMKKVSKKREKRRATEGVFEGKTQAEEGSKEIVLGGEGPS